MMIDWLSETLISSTLLIITILLLRKLVGNYIGARWIYGLWFVPLLLVLLPEFTIILPELLTPITQLSNVSSLNIQGNVEVMQTNNLSTISNNASFDNAYFIYQATITLWFIGAIIYWVILWRQHKKFIINSTANLSEASKPIQDSIKKLRLMLRQNKMPLVLFSSSIKTPFVYGVLKPKLILPKGIFNNFNNKQVEMLLCHELIHLKRGDLFFNLLGQVYVGLFWFNPFVHVAFKVFKIDQEKSCDELVINKLSLTDFRHCYGQLLLESALLNNKPSPLLSLWGASSKTQTRERIEMLKHYRNNNAKHLLGLLTVTLISFIFLTNVSAQQISIKNQDITSLFTDISEYIDKKLFKKALVSLNSIAINELNLANKDQQAKYFALKTITHIQLNHPCDAKKSLLSMQKLDTGLPITKQANINFGFYRSKSSFNTKQLNCMLTAIIDLNNQGDNHKLSLDLSINFDLQSDAIITSDNQQLVELGNLLTNPKYKKHYISIIGHTDSYGPKEENLALSKRRANTVLSELERIQPTLQGRLKAIAQGELNPIASNDSEQGREINRRVEILLNN